MVGQTGLIGFAKSLQTYVSAIETSLTLVRASQLLTLFSLHFSFLRNFMLRNKGRGSKITSTHCKQNLCLYCLFEEPFQIVSSQLHKNWTVKSCVQMVVSFDRIIIYFSCKHSLSSCHLCHCDLIY